MNNATSLGFDYGRKRIGVAVGQQITCTARALTTIVCKNGPDWTVIDGLIAEWQPAQLVVGMPYSMDERPHPLHDEVKAFGDQLRDRYNLTIEWVDERLTSLEAEHQLREDGAKRLSKNNKTDIDKLAAQIILQSWLETQQN